MIALRRIRDAIRVLTGRTVVDANGDELAEVLDRLVRETRRNASLEMQVADLVRWLNRYEREGVTSSVQAGLDAMVDALRTVIAESEGHTFGTPGYDMILDHLHDIAVGALTEVRA